MAIMSPLIDLSLFQLWLCNRAASREAEYAMAGRMIYTSNSAASSSHPMLDTS